MDRIIKMKAGEGLPELEGIEQYGGGMSFGEKVMLWLMVGPFVAWFGFNFIIYLFRIYYGDIPGLS